MKNLLLAIVLLVSTVTFAQETTEQESSYYFATGVSITNSNNFAESSYVSAEVGVMRDNVAFGVVVGRNNLANIGTNESFNNYWYEGKVAVYQQVGVVDAYGLVGVGSYIENGDIFLEYGIGVSKEFEDLGVFIQVSNWDGTTYITPGISIGL